MISIAILLLFIPHGGPHFNHTVRQREKHAEPSPHPLASYQDSAFSFVVSITDGAVVADALGVSRVSCS
jgi:hypothetical protein